jgi:hypothetical protein
MDINTWAKKYQYAIGGVALLVLVVTISMMNRTSPFLLPNDKTITLSHEPVEVPSGKTFDFARVPNQVTRNTFETVTETHPIWPELSLNGKVFGLNLATQPQLEISNPKSAVRTCNLPQTSLLMDRAIMDAIMICAEFDGPLVTTYEWAHTRLSVLDWVKHTTKMMALDGEGQGWKNTNQQSVREIGTMGDVTYFETQIGDARPTYRAVAVLETDTTRDLGVRIMLDVTASLGENPEQTKKLVESHMVRIKSAITEVPASY